MIPQLSIIRGCTSFTGIQNILGRVVNMESPEKKPASSSTVKNSVRLRATRYLE
jgi:hypothetical protein